MIDTYQKALERYFTVMGDMAPQPNYMLSAYNIERGRWELNNIHGHLAFVGIKKGTVWSFSMYEKKFDNYHREENWNSGYIQ